MAGALAALADRVRGRQRRRHVAGEVAALGMRASGGGVPEIAPAPGAFHVNDGPHYHDVLAALHAILKPQWYLEIGARGGQSLALARCNFVAIDPVFQRFPEQPAAGAQMHFLALTSDDAFASGFLAREEIRPDLGFLDGMHLAGFLMRDLMNFKAAARPGAVAVLHDCLPCTHAMEARDPGITATGAPWTGDVWKVLAWLRRHRPDLAVHALDAWPTGLVVIERLDPENRVLPGLYDRFVTEMGDLRLADFGTDRFLAEAAVESSHIYIENLRRRAAA